MHCLCVWLINNDSSHGFSVQSLVVYMRHSSGMGHHRSDEVTQTAGRHHHISNAVNPIQRTMNTSFVLFSAFCDLTKHLPPSVNRTRCRSGAKRRRTGPCLASRYAGSPCHRCRRPWRPQSCRQPSASSSTTQ